MFPLETQTVSHQHFSNFLHTSVAASNLKMVLEVPKASGKIQKDLKVVGGGGWGGNSTIDFFIFLVSSC